MATVSERTSSRWRGWNDEVNGHVEVHTCLRSDRQNIWLQTSITAEAQPRQASPTYDFVRSVQREPRSFTSRNVKWLYSAGSGFMIIQCVCPKREWFAGHCDELMAMRNQVF